MATSTLPKAELNGTKPSANAAVLEPLKARSAIPALELAKTPRATRRYAVYLLMFMVLLIPALMFVPWTQTVYGAGRAIAFNPTQRPQFIVSPIEGRVKKWYVYEGDSVVAGQLIAELVDNDPRRLERLEEQEQLALQRVVLAEGRVRDLENRLTLVRDEREPIMADAEQRILQTEQQVLVAQQELDRAKADMERENLNYQRQLRLYKAEAGKVVAEADVEEAKRRYDLAKAQIPLVEARIKLARSMVDSAKAFRDAQDKRTNATIKTEEAALRSAQGGKPAAVQQQYNTIKIELERQRNQFIKAPTDGKIFRLLANAEAGGMLVRPGERLAIIVPDIKPWLPIPAEKREAVMAIAGVSGQSSYQSLTPSDQPGTVCELFIDGNDLPLVRKGDRVLLQFEGFPAVQFAGIPDVAMGVFEGKIYLVDPTADDKDKFRILVEPMTTKPEGEIIDGRRVTPWPEERFIRQGLRVQGWTLVNEVSLGWEIWRLLNGFPPARELNVKGKDGGILGPVSVGGKK